ncbi:MAG: alpha-glucan family phosphorylase [Mariniphaga sp.]|nr:alpha-glucan family phosphorylase [Mariniphaga sp.]
MESNKNTHIQPPAINDPVWKKFIVESELPEKLSPLREMSRNLWWTWSIDARNIFECIDETIWEACEHNPIVLLEEVNYKRLKELENDDHFIEEMHKAYDIFKEYLREREIKEGPSIAYFSMEYGLHDSLKIFSGGLGILAGDYLKQASDSNVNLVGVGLLYRYGYFKQTLNLHGEQMANYESQHFSKIPVHPAFDKDGNWVQIEVEYPGRTLKAKVWEVHIGSVKLYLLDADISANSPEDRFVTHHLYGGDNENRLKQEILLGIGGIKALRKLGHKSDIYHCNEGHAAFIGIERTAEYISNQNLSYAQAKEVVRASTLFTTHTPVPAGHDSFHVSMFENYMRSFAVKLDLSWDEFLMLGKTNPNEDHFNMSFLASHMSQGINGVSKLHGDVSKTILKDLFKGFLEEELEIGYVTNGVHYCTWAAQEWKKIHKKYFGKGFPMNQLDKEVWQDIYKVDDEEIWKLRQNLRLKMIDYIKQRFTDNWIKRNENPKLISEILGELNPNALTIGFARRFATYKRAHLLFRNTERLAEILNNPEKPVQFLFAGKAHPADKAGQDLIKHIVEISKRPEFIGKILFVQNYDMNLAKMLLQGVDVWLNTPTRPLEASGTSGEKGVMNGTLHFSVLDGWWVEGYKKDAGWALPLERAYDVQDFQDELDAETIYTILEDEIMEVFYDRNKHGIPERWIGFIKNTLAQVSPDFTTARMIHDYQERYYNPQFERTQKIVADDFRLAKELADWKTKVSSMWNQIEVKDVQVSDGIENAMKVGNFYPVKVAIDLKGLNSHEVGLEMVITQNGGDNPHKLIDKIEFDVEQVEGSICIYKLNMHPVNAGSFNYSMRLFPKNENLPHRQDFGLVKWI